METSHQETRIKQDFDVSIIRPQMHNEDVQLRGRGLSPSRLRSIKRALLSLHTLEGMAVNIYKFQVTRRESELNRQLIAAMCNEMTHLQDFQVKLFEYGWRPSKLRWMYLTVGFVLGFSSRLMGTEKVLKTGIWAETKAVDEYEKLLRTVDWDEDTRQVVQKNQADEHGHINTWRKFLKSS